MASVDTSIGAKLDCMVMKEVSLYRAQREASEDAAWQSAINLFRRVLGMNIKRTALQAEIESLKRNGFGPEHSQWGKCRGIG